MAWGSEFGLQAEEFGSKVSAFGGSIGSSGGTDPGQRGGRGLRVEG
jgi:hypothetical protein